MKPQAASIEVIKGDEVRTKSRLPRNHFKSDYRKKELEDNIFFWQNMPVRSLELNISQGNIIIDPWSTLDNYTGLELPAGYAVVSTSKFANHPGTIYIEGTNSDTDGRIKKGYKQYLTDHGLSLAQADTFITTLFYAKFATLPFLHKALNDSTLYRAMRLYTVNFSRTEFFDWIDQFSLRDNEVYQSIDNNDRLLLSEMLNRMAGADKKLVEYRERMRKKKRVKTA